MDRKFQHRNIFGWITGLCLLSFSISVLAEDNARLILTGNSLLLDKNARSESLYMVNKGKRTGVFEVRWIDHTMTESGDLYTWQPPELSSWSLQPYARFTPRRVTLKPNESQVIRVALTKKARKAADGEYFSHLNVITINDNLEETLALKERSASASDSSQNPEEQISIKARLGISIPVIWRNSEQVPKALLEIHGFKERHQAFDEGKTVTISDGNLDAESDEMLLKVTREGAVSTRGYLHVYLQHDNKREQIMDPHPFIIYPSIKSRELSLKLPRHYAEDSQFEVIYSESRNDFKDVIGSATAKLTR